MFVFSFERVSTFSKLRTCKQLMINQPSLNCALFLNLFFFSSPEHEVLRVSYCDHSLSVGDRRTSVFPPSVVCSHFLVYTLASTNINQSAPNLVKMYMTIRSRTSSIMEVIGSQLSELSALELENLPYLTLFTL